MTKDNQNKIVAKLDTLEKLILDSRDEKIMCFSECADYLNLSRSYLYKLTMTGSIPHYKPNGKKLYFSKIEVDKWIKGASNE